MNRTHTILFLVYIAFIVLASTPLFMQGMYQRNRNRRFPQDYRSQKKIIVDPAHKTVILDGGRMRATHHRRTDSSVPAAIVFVEVKKGDQHGEHSVSHPATPASISAPTPTTTPSCWARLCCCLAMKTQS
jgi:hypothetical protein